MNACMATFACTCSVLPIICSGIGPSKCGIFLLSLSTFNNSLSPSPPPLSLSPGKKNPNYYLFTESYALVRSINVSTNTGDCCSACRRRKFSFSWHKVLSSHYVMSLIKFAPFHSGRRHGASAFNLDTSIMFMLILYIRKAVLRQCSSHCCAHLSISSIPLGPTL